MYYILASIGVTTSELYPMHYLFDTSAQQNIVAKCFVPTLWMYKVTT